MAAPLYFTCGTYDVPVGAKEFTITGLGISFAPASVSVSVRQPVPEADVISASVIGAPTADGFTVFLSAPAEVAGYVLDWQAMSGATFTVDSGSGALGYDDFMKGVARFLGYDYDNLTEAQVAECDNYVQAGVHNFYYPPKMEGVDETFEWEFLKREGSILMSAGQSEYLLENGFGRVAGGFSFDPSHHCRGIQVIPFGEISRMPSDVCGRPHLASVVYKNQFGVSGQRASVRFFPTPDKPYVVTFRYDADAGKLDSTERPYPLGGSMFSELVMESCLAVAEQRANDEIGIHTQNFNSHLVAMIARGRKQSAQVYGFVGEQRNELPGW